MVKTYGKKKAEVEARSRAASGKLSWTPGHRPAEARSPRVQRGLPLTSANHQPREGLVCTVTVQILCGQGGARGFEARSQSKHSPGFSVSCLPLLGLRTCVCL